MWVIYWIDAKNGAKKNAGIRGKKSPLGKQSRNMDPYPLWIDSMSRKNDNKEPFNSFESIETATESKSNGIKEDVADDAAKGDGLLSKGIKLLSNALSKPRYFC